MTSNDLKDAILQLECKQANELFLLKKEFRNTYETLKPVNLLKSSFSNLLSDSDFKGNILDTVISLAAGFLSKKTVVGSSHNPIKQLLGTFLQIGVTSLVSKNTEGIKSNANRLLDFFLRKKS